MTSPADGRQRWLTLLGRRWVLIVLLVVVWWVLATLLRGIHTLSLSTATDTWFTALLRELTAVIRGNRTESPVFIYLFNPIRVGIEGFIDSIRAVISVPAPGNLIPLMGWLGTLAVIALIVYATSNLRTAALCTALLLGCLVLGMWTYTLDTLAMTLGAVALSLAIGLPLGVWAGLSDRVMAALRPGLDLAQILPTLVYLAPLALVFLIGVASATIATMVYSIPICIRITAHAIRSLRASPLEAATAMGSTRWQLLTKVQLPMARRTIILGINQTTLAALSFVVIAALIGAPGLGKPVVEALIIRDVGDGIVAGIAVVLLAIMLDRATTAAVVHTDEVLDMTEHQRRLRRIGLVVAGLATIAAIIASRYLMWAAVVPERLDIGEQVGRIAGTVVTWITTNLGFATTGLNEFITVTVLNPVEGILANAPWYLTVIMISVLAAIIGGRTAGLVAVCLLTAIVVIGLWNDTMITLAQVLLATVVVMVVGVVLGVLAGRSTRVERALKPLLDAGQTLPAFVYLVPVLALFGPTRFASIVCGVFYAAPVVVRVVADGVRGVPAEMVEAATSAGSTRTQIITKVQLPASRRSLMLGANQGLIFVLAVVVIGGFVGAGGLGYLVIVGQSKPELAGKGLAAGLAIVLLGIVLDRIAQSGGRSRPTGQDRWAPGH
ncbi:MAG: ABC transporter permease subunit [Actinomycetales bacterium]|nr:ABC transporter permease subunit [Actinomycetales bacterium]